MTRIQVSVAAGAAACLLSTGAAQAQTTSAADAQTQASAQITAPAPRVATAAEVEASKAALGALIAGLQSGAPDYTKLDERLGAAVKAQQPSLTPGLAALGKVEAVEHVGARPDGLQRFKVQFEEGATTWAVLLNPTGQISGLVVE